jgi:hypothetical protein
LEEQKDFQEHTIQESMAIPVAAQIPIITRNEQKPVYLPAEFSRAVEILQEEYEKTKNNTYIHNAIAWALYHTWRRIDARRD